MLTLNILFNSGGNIDNKKKYFRNIVNNYNIDNNNNLLFKFYYKDNKIQNINNNNKRKKSKNYKLMTVPFVKDIKVFLNQIHIEAAHRGRDALRNALSEKNIY